MAEGAPGAPGGSPVRLPRPWAERFEIRRRLAPGVFGPSWLVQEVASGALAVARCFPSYPAHERSVLSELQRAAEQVAACPSAARTLEIFDEGGTPWLMRDWIAGESLAEAIAALGRLTAEQAIAIADTVCRGLVSGEAGEIVHGHLAPENIVVTGDGTLWLTDHGYLGAGIAPLRPQPIPFLAPEVVAGSAPSGRSDVYALGAILYAAVCGRYPVALDGDGVAAMGALRTHSILEPGPGSAMTGGLGRIVWQALQPHPDERIATVTALRSALLAHRGVEGLSGRRRGPRRWPFGRR